MVARQSNFDESTVSGQHVVRASNDVNYRRHILPGLHAECPNCKAKMWIWERAERSPMSNPVFSTCCSKGKVKIPAIESPPEVILSLLTGNDQSFVQFRRSIRAYNNIFALASNGADPDRNLANGRQGVYTFRINGNIHHQIGPFLPPNGQERPRFAQIYIYDREMQIDHRRTIMQNLDESILRRIQDWLLANNQFAQTIQFAAERLRNEPEAELSIRISGSTSQNRRQYTAPSVRSGCHCLRTRK